MSGALAPHGTYARYQQHRLLSQEPCVPCRAALRDYMRNYRATRMKPLACVGGLGWPEQPGSSWRTRANP